MYYKFEDTEKEIDVNLEMYFIGERLSRRMVDVAKLISHPDSGDGSLDYPLQFEIKGSEDDTIVTDRFEFLLIENYLEEDSEILVRACEQQASHVSLICTRHLIPNAPACSLRSAWDARESRRRTSSPSWSTG